jgi:hypothetical protein
MNYLAESHPKKIPALDNLPSPHRRRRGQDQALNHSKRLREKHVKLEKGRPRMLRPPVRGPFRAFQAFQALQSVGVFATGVQVSRGSQ